jgi:hypothetical protein
MGKTQRMIGLLCAVLKMLNYSLSTFSLLIKLPHYVLYACYVCSIVLLKLCMLLKAANTVVAGRMLVSPNLCNEDDDDDNNNISST